MRRPEPPRQHAGRWIWEVGGGLLLVGAVIALFVAIRPNTPATRVAQGLTETLPSANLSPKQLTATAMELVWRETQLAAPLTPPAASLATWTPAVGPTRTPNYSYAENRPAGDGILVEANTAAPPDWHGKGTVNFWSANYADIIVIAGWVGTDSYPGTQGALFIIAGGDASNPETDETPIQDGAAKIVDGMGHSLLVRTAVNNRLLAFDVDTRKFSSPPDVGQISGPTSPVLASTGVRISAAFTDAIPSEVHTAVVDWGDGTTSPAAVTEANGSGTAAGTHGYNFSGVYSVVLTITDSAGASGSSTYHYIVVYDPKAGFVTGGGWIESPTGAYPSKPGLAGKVEFQFDAKYERGKSVPTGSTAVTIDAAGVNLASNSYDWLVIVGPKAQLKGSATLNGSGTYAFWLTAWDNNVGGGTKPDLFRVRIWDKLTGNVVYDNMPGAADDADPTTPLGGGSIAVHKSGQ